ncbi:MAG: TIGR02281 family clan AA aspartic protease [Cycloclasticus sp.]|nr:aspartyl protease [Cycloclasticus sp. 46_83_sub15_T18]
MKSITSPNKISKVMVSLAWLALLIMLVLGFDRYLEKQTNPNDRPEFVYAADGSAEVTLLQNRQGHYIAEGKINDQWALFVLDTGATNISIPGNVAKKMHLTGGYPERTRTANGDITVYRVMLDSVKLGSIELKNIAAHINPNMNGKGVLLGMSFLKHLEMLQKDQKLTLRLGAMASCPNCL